MLQGCLTLIQGETRSSLWDYFLDRDLFFIESEILFLCRSTSSTLDGDLLLALTTSVGFFAVAISKLADMHEAVLMNAYVHEGPKSSDIGHNARQLNAHLEFSIFSIPGAKLKASYPFLGSRPGPGQLIHNVSSVAAPAFSLM